MTGGTTRPPFEALAARLTAKARAIGEASLRARILARRRDGRRWRRAALLWPLFTKG